MLKKRAKPKKNKWKKKNQIKQIKTTPNKCDFVLDRNLHEYVFLIVFLYLVLYLFSNFVRSYRCETYLHVEMVRPQPMVVL